MSVAEALALGPWDDEDCAPDFADELVDLVDALEDEAFPPYSPVGLALERARNALQAAGYAVR